MDLQRLLTIALEGLGYELVDLELSPRKRFFRVFIDKVGGVTVDDCARVSNHLTRLFAAERVDYEQLEVSSPGLDRPLKKLADFERFVGEKIRIKLRHPVEGRANFVGVLGSVRNGKVLLDVEGTSLEIDLAELEKARLVPGI